MNTEFYVGVAVVPASLLVSVVLFRWFAVTNPESHETLQLRFGRLLSRWKESGFIGGVSKFLPWDQWIQVSRQWDQKFLRGIETNDSQGTSVRIDLRVNYRITDGEKALFEVHDWEEALESVTAHEAAALLAGCERNTLIRSSTVLSQELTDSVRGIMAQYGVEVRGVRILNVEFRGEVARQMFEAVAAKLQVAKAEFEERGRNEAALLQAQTEQRVAVLEAQAKTENLKSVGRAYQELKARAGIYEAYAEIHKLSEMDPERIVSFDGFSESEISSGSLAEADLEQNGMRNMRMAEA